MIEHSIGSDQIVFKVMVVPRASRSEIVGEHNGALKVRLAAPPVDGAANDELVRVIAKRLQVARSAVEIVSGQHSKTKQVRVIGNREELLNLFVEIAE